MRRLDDAEQRVRESTLRSLRDGPEHYLTRYTEEFGNVLNADDAAKLFPEYNEDRARFRGAVHLAATWIRDELFRRALAETDPDPGKNRVLFTAGSNAAGKSTAISFTGERARAQVIFDSTFSNPEHATSLVEQALAAGKAVTILYVNRPLELAFRGMVDRVKSEGRVVTIAQLIGSHKGAAQTARALWDRFHDDPRFAFQFVENSEETRLATVELAARKDYTEIGWRLYELLNAEYEDGRIVETFYRQIRGREEPSQSPSRRPAGRRGLGGLSETRAKKAGRPNSRPRGVAKPTSGPLSSRKPDKP